MPEVIDTETLTTAAAAEALGVGDDRARQLADQHGLVVGRTASGERIISARRTAALAIARAARKLRTADERRAARKASR